MKPLSRRVMVAGFFLALALIAAVTWLNLNQLGQAQNSADWVAHTNLARYHLSRLLSSLQDVETDVDGFVLTGAKFFQERYAVSVRDIAKQVATVRKLTATVPEQQQTLDHLETAIARRLSAADEIMRAREEAGFEVAHALIASNNGSESLETLRAHVAGMEEVEVRLLRERMDANQRKVRNVRTVTVAAAGMSFFLLSGVFAIVFQENRLRRRVEVTLRESETLLRCVLDSMPSSIAVVDRMGKILATNEAWTAFARENGAEDQLGAVGVGVNYLDVCERATKDLGEAKTIFLKLRDLLSGAGSQFVTEYACHSPTEHRWFNMNAFPLDRPEGGAVIAHTNITERKRAEEKLREKNEEIERFTNAVSHDLKSPLVTVRTFLDFLETDLQAQDPDAVAKDLAYIRSASEKMDRMLGELLELARIGHMRSSAVSCRLQDVVQEALDLVAGQIASRGIRVEVTPEPVWIYGDRPRLVEVFQNLLDNAAKFMGGQPSPLIEVGVEMEAREIRMFVRDNGKGIDPRHHSKLFGLFEKLDPHTPGSGIGLAMVRRIVEAHGGQISAHSDGLEKGSTFRFTLAKTTKGSPAL